MKRVKMLVLISVLALLFTPTMALSMSLTVEDGKLVGATGVEVDGKSHSVTFVDGTGVDIFHGADDISDFVFQTRTQADNASTALINQVFSVYTGQLTSIRGIENDDPTANIFTPFETRVSSLDSSIFFSAVVFSATDGVTSHANMVVLGAGLPTYWDLATDPNAVYAVWTPTTVPEPPEIMLIVFGLIGLWWGRMKWKTT